MGIWPKPPAGSAAAKPHARRRAISRIVQDPYGISPPDKTAGGRLFVELSSFFLARKDLHFKAKCRIGSRPCFTGS